MNNKITKILKVRTKYINRRIIKNIMSLRGTYCLYYIPRYIIFLLCPAGERWIGYIKNAMGHNIYYWYKNN